MVPSLKGEDLSSKTNYSKDKLEITIKKSFNLLTNFKILSYEVCIEEVQLLVRLCAFSSAQFMLQVRSYRNKFFRQKAEGQKKC